jgi:glycosyltransferase involved in cell wall biosynthesis
MRFVFLQTGMTGYQDACLRALNAQGHEILNVFPEAYHNAQFDAHSFRQYGEALIWGEVAPPVDELIRRVEAFAPDAIIMTSWQQPTYRKVMAHMRGRALRIMISSNVWESRAKQWLGRATHRVYLRPLYDAVFVPGDRSEWFARRLGFRADQVIRGTNTADVELFDQGPREEAELSSAHRFLFTGRLMPYKGVNVLREAYELYRAENADPWDIDIVGTGELAAQLTDVPGARMHGFLQPPELAKLMHETTCLVLPSFMDFFGVVVHEAALSGQVLLCTDSVGATPYLLQDGFNGWTVATGDVRSLADALSRVAALPPERLMEMSEGSRRLATRFSPALWARNLSEEVGRRWPAAGSSGERPPVADGKVQHG